MWNGGRRPPFIPTHTALFSHLYPHVNILLLLLFVSDDQHHLLSASSLSSKIGAPKSKGTGQQNRQLPNEAMPPSSSSKQQSSSSKVTLPAESAPAASSRSTDGIAKIVDRLYLSAKGPAKKLSTLQRLHITHVVTLAGPKTKWHTDAGITYLAVGALDGETADISRHFETTTRFIHEARQKPNGGGVLVHCSAGISRGPTILIAYLMAAGLASGYEDALRMVRAGRARAQPNPGFEQQLRALEEAIKTNEAGWWTPFR